MPLLLGICKNCGKKFEYYPSQTTGNFCSSTCWHEYARGENHPSYKGRLPSNCKQCGKEVIDVKHPNRKFCTRKCYVNWLERYPPKFSLEHRRKLSEAKNGKDAWNKGKKGIFSEEALRKLSEIGKNRIVSEETKEKRSKSIKEKWKDPIYREKQIPSRIGNRNPFFGKKMPKDHLKKMILGWKKRPTKPEEKLIEIIKKFNFPYKYIKNGEFMIHNLCPDFIDTSNQNKVIEVFGRAFHDPDHTFKDNIPLHQQYEGRTSYYKDLGYDCLIFWEDEIENEQKTVERVRSFTGDMICA